MWPKLRLALITDASLHAVAAILFQPRFEGELPNFENIIGMYSKTLDVMQQRWHSYKRECYAAYLGIKHFMNSWHLLSLIYLWMQKHWFK